MNIFSGRIWLIGGTCEGIELAIALSQRQIPCTVSVATDSASTGYPTHPCLRIVVNRFQPSELQAFLRAEHIVAILDASHPFALEISQLAIKEAARTQIPYLRYERPTLIGHDSERNPQILELDSLSTLLNGDHLVGQRVLLTLGYKSLAQFQPWHNRSQLFARILPSPVALETALSAGFGRDRLLALHPPVPMDLEIALWKHWQISVVVTKASGAAGGEATKRQVATFLGVKLIVLKRPQISYPQQTSTMEVALEFCFTAMKLGNRTRRVTTDG